MTAEKTLAVLALCALAAGALSAQSSGANWTDYLGGPDSSLFSPLKQITPANAGRLDAAWTYATGDNGTYFFSPLVVNNVVFVAAKQGALLVLDATAAKELWGHSFPAGENSAGAFTLKLDARGRQLKREALSRAYGTANHCLEEGPTL